MNLGALLRTARVDSGLSQIELARRVGVSRQALSRWESGSRPVRSDDADRVLAACGRDVRFSIVHRHADTDELLHELAAAPVLDRYSQFGVVLTQLLEDLQSTGVVRFSRGWAAAAVGLPALRRCGGIELPGDPSAQAKAAAVLAPWAPSVWEDGEWWGAGWDDQVFERNPAATWSSPVLGDFFVEAVDQDGPEHRVQVGEQSWRVVDPGRLVPDDVDAATLDQWRRLAT
jgi:transcriptional regulator with XRE-family HTH domain